MMENGECKFPKMTPSGKSLMCTFDIPGMNLRSSFSLPSIPAFAET